MTKISKDNTVSDLQEEIARLEKEVLFIRLRTLDAVKRELSLNIWTPDSGKAMKKEVFAVIDELIEKGVKKGKK